MNIESALKSDYSEMMEVWEASVRATHHFLKEDDILFFKKMIPEKYLDATRLYVVRGDMTKILGFLGVSNDGIEMLFIRPEARGKGIGKIFLDYAVKKLRLDKVDVNEQNEQAVGFYLKYGFKIIGRSELDDIGKPYPILHMAL